MSIYYRRNDVFDGPCPLQMSLTKLGGCRPLPAIPETERSEGYQSEDEKVAE